MASALDTEQILLISRARQGNPQAIAALLQRDLKSGGVEVCGWKRGRILRLELMSSAVVGKTEALRFVRRAVDYLQPQDIDAVHLSLYLNDEHEPRWVERIAPGQAFSSPAFSSPAPLGQTFSNPALPSQALSIQRSRGLGQRLHETKALRRRWRRPAGWAIAAAIVLAGTLLVALLS